MKKIVPIVCISIALFSFMVATPLFAFAANDTVYFTTMSDPRYLVIGEDTWYSASGLCTWDSSNGSFYMGHSSNNPYGYNGFKYSLTADTYVKVNAGYYFKMSLTFIGNYDVSMSDEPSMTLQILSGDGNIYNFNGYFEQKTSSFQYTVFANVGNGSAFTFGKMIVTGRNIRSNSNGMSSYNIAHSFTITTELTPEERRHVETIEAIDDQTDTLTNGWSTGDTSGADTNDKASDISNGEDAALGGRDASDVNSDYSNSVNVNILNTGSASDISGFFTSCLNVFGLHYKSVMILSLSLGLACFLVGRRYRAG